jgi:hypothetical protein
LRQRQNGMVVIVTVTVIVFVVIVIETGARWIVFIFAAA